MLPDGTMVRHDHYGTGQPENSASMEVRHKTNVLGVVCYACGFRGEAISYLL